MKSIDFKGKKMWAVYALAIIAVIIILSLSGNSTGTVKPRKGPIVEAVYALGSVKSYSTYNLKMGMPSAIRKLHVFEGKMVSRGDPLVLNDSGMTFRSPFDGTVNRVYCEEGEVMMTGAPVLTVMDLGNRYVQVSLDQNSALKIRRGQKAELSFETLRGKKLTGKVISIYPSTGQFLARITVDNMPPEVLPDMTADVAIEIARRDNAILIPLNAVNKGVVTLMRDRKQFTVNPALGAVDGAWGEVLDGSVLVTDQIVTGK